MYHARYRNYPKQCVFELSWPAAAMINAGVYCMPQGVMDAAFIQAVGIGKLLRTEATLVHVSSDSLHFSVTIQAADNMTQLSSPAAVCVKMTAVITRPTYSPDQATAHIEQATASPPGQGSRIEIRSKL